MMYAALWRILPGPVWLRVFLLLVLASIALYGLFFHVFPWVSTLMIPGEVDLE
jgi:hypothetical protein